MQGEKEDVEEFKKQKLNDYNKKKERIMEYKGKKEMSMKEEK